MALWPRLPGSTAVASTHLRGMPQTLCSSQGVCSWDSPTAGRQKKPVSSHTGESGQKAAVSDNPSRAGNPGYREQGQEGAQFQAQGE